MKVILILLISHLLVCAVLGYAFGRWSTGPTIESDEQGTVPTATVSGKTGYLGGRTAYTDYFFTPPRAVVFYGVAGLIGIVAALVAELYHRLFSGS